MKPRTILLLSADLDCEKTVLDAARQTNHEVRTAYTCAAAMRLLIEGTKDLALFIVDLDPQVHGLTLLTAVAGCPEDIPIIALTEHEESLMAPLVYLRGAMECLGKPVGAGRIVEAIEHYSRSYAATADPEAACITKPLERCT